MKRSFALVLIAIFAVVRAGAAAGVDAPPGHPSSTAHNSDSYPADQATVNARAGVRKVEVAVTMEEKGKAATAFPVNAPQLFAVFKTYGTKKGEKARGVWISQTGASKKKLYETTLTGNQADFVGSFSIKAPATGWPP